LWIEN